MECDRPNIPQEDKSEDLDELLQDKTEDLTELLQVSEDWAMKDEQFVTAGYGNDKPKNKQNLSTDSKGTARTKFSEEEEKEIYQLF
jgi:hypothetical protein